MSELHERGGFDRQHAPATGPDAAEASPSWRGPEPVIDLAWSPDSSRVAGAALDGSVMIVADSVSSSRPRHDGGTRTVAWSPDGQVLASGGHDGRMVLARPDTEEPADTCSVVVDLGGWVHDLAWWGDRIGVVAGSDAAIHRRDGTVVGRWPWQAGTMSACAWRNDGEWLVVGGVGGVMGFAPGGRAADPVWRAPAVGAVLDLAVHPTLDLVAVADLAGEVRVLSIGGTDETVLSGYPERVARVRWAAAGRAVVADAADEVTVWPVDADSDVAGRPSHLVRHAGAVTALAWSPDGAALALATSDATVTMLR